MTCSELTILAITPIINGVLNTVNLAAVVVLTVKFAEATRQQRDITGEVRRLTDWVETLVSRRS